MIVLGWLVALHRAEPLPGPHQGHCDHPGWLVAPHILKASRPEKGSNFHPLMPPLFLSFLSAWLLKKIKHGWFHLGRISIPGRAGGCDQNVKPGATELPGKGRGAAVPGGGPGVGQRAPAHQGAMVGLNAIGRVRLGVAQGLASGPGLGEEEMGVALARTCGFLWP